MKTVSRSRVRVRLELLLCTFVLGGLLSAQVMSRMLSAQPEKGKVGDEITVTGENLGKNHVAEIFFTRDNTDIKLPIAAQSATELKFKIPREAKAGRYSLMLLTTGLEPKMIEQPVKVTVE